MIRILLIAWLLGLPMAGTARHFEPDESANLLFIELANEINCIRKYFQLEKENEENRLAIVRSKLLLTAGCEYKMDLLIEKDVIQERIQTLQNLENIEIAKVKYLKGLQIIKILYEKVLSLDHHFASVRTLNEINKISNPNQYPEYAKLKEIVANKRDKKSAFDLTAILSANPLMSIVQTFAGMFTANMSGEEKKKELEKVECILDFTLRMQNDLNTIYFETAFLQSSNDRIKQDVEILFREYTKPIGYAEPLEACRTKDDWESITLKTEEYLTKLRSATGSAQYRMQVNIEFPIDRLMQFINQYNAFIDQGGKFYEKFRIILNSYENEKQCDAKLPAEYKKMQADIDLAVSKFNVAYKPVEINGTKMKEILYGLNEFD